MGSRLSSSTTTWNDESLRNKACISVCYFAVGQDERRICQKHGIYYSFRTCRLEIFPIRIDSAL
jgi:hypothetical protein